jgi:hypothetical protein
MYQLRLYGPSFELDNRTVYRKLKAFLVDTPAWAWIEPYDLAKNGRAAHQAWVNHYNGQGEVSKRTAMAKMRRASLHYGNERSLAFESCAEMMSKCFNTLHKDVDQRLSPRQKVEKLLSVITCDNTELIAAKVYINMEYPLDFVEACNYFSAEVARVTGPALMENQRNKSRKRQIYSIDSQNGHGGRGRSRTGGRGSRQGSGRTRNPGTINGVNTSDPNRSFTRPEWEALGSDGRDTVLALRGSTSRSGSGGRGRRGGGRRGRGRGGGRSQATDRNVSSTEIVEYDADQNDESTDTTRPALNDRGGRNGRGFGRGAYGSQGGRS